MRKLGWWSWSPSLSNLSFISSIFTWLQKYSKGMRPNSEVSYTVSLPEHSTLSKQATRPTHIHRIGKWILPYDKGSCKEFEAIFSIPQGAKGFQLWEPASKSPIPQRPKEVISYKSEEGSFTWIRKMDDECPQQWQSILRSKENTQRNISQSQSPRRSLLCTFHLSFPCFNKVRKWRKMGEQGQKQKAGKEKKEPALFLNFLFAKGPSWGKI